MSFKNLLESILNEKDSWPIWKPGEVYKQNDSIWAPGAEVYFLVLSFEKVYSPGGTSWYPKVQGLSNSATWKPTKVQKSEKTNTHPDHYTKIEKKDIPAGVQKAFKDKKYTK